MTVTLPPGDLAVPSAGTADGLSWILTGLFLVFFLVCIRYRRNSRYFSLILNDATEVRERSNVFDDTLREKSLVWLLNLLWCGSAGLLLYFVASGETSALNDDNTAVWRMALCMAVGLAYTLFLSLAYFVAGNVFTDTGKATLWLKGYLASQGLAAVGLFPLALLSICMPSILIGVLYAAAAVFVIAKLLFIYKGFCIFFAENGSLLLFLYYLCSLEIVPVVLAYAGASYYCRMI